MSWGTELWDQYEQIAIHTEKGLSFCDRYCNFIKERCAIEQDYASKLKRLVKNYQPKKKDEAEAQDYSRSTKQWRRNSKIYNGGEQRFSYYQGFLDMIKEVHDISGQHEVIAENLTSSIVRETTQMLNEIKHERKKYLHEGTKQAASLQHQLAQLDKAKKQYEKAFKEAERAQEAFKKADNDLNLSRAEVERAKNISMVKRQHCEDCKSEYALELQKSNDAQREHYSKHMPDIFQRLQEMEERRICRFQTFIRQGATIERNVIPIINTCIAGMDKAADSIVSTEDSKLVIEKHKTGFHPPGDISFEDLSQSMENHNTPTQRSNNTPRTVKEKGTYGPASAGKNKKQRGGFKGLFSKSKTDDTKEDFSHLPPNQQRKNLSKHIGELQTVIRKETSERDGMMKLRDVYQKTPALGDATSLDKQLEENAQKLDKLKLDLNKYEGYLQNMDAQTSTNLPQIEKAFQNYSDESMNRSTSEQSVASNKPEQNNHTYNDAHESPDSGINEHHPSPQASHQTSHQDSFCDQDSFDDNVEDDEDSDLQSVGLAKALYEFEAVNAGSLSMLANEEFSIIECDQGDGWTRVRRHSNLEEGFVPSAYLQITMNS